VQQGLACVPNIGAAQRRQRFTGGLLALAGAAALLVVLLLTGTPRVFRLIVALPLWPGVLGVLQAREKT
jgi:hypothetical protein